MILKEALSLVDTWDKPILISDKNGKEYYYKNIDEFLEDSTCNKLSQLEVTHIDVDGGTNHPVVFEVW